MSESAWGLRRRAAVSLESSFGTSDGSWTQIRGIEDVNLTLNQVAIEDNRHVLSTKSNHAPFLGPKSATLTFRVPWHDSIVADCGPLFKSAIGSVSANTMIYNDTGSTDGVIVKSAGTHDPILMITGAAGGIVARPVKSVSTNDGTLGVKLQGGTDPTAATNPITTNGACYIADPTADTVTVSMELDRAGENDSLPYTLNRGVVTGMTLELDLAGRMGFAFTVEFYGFSQASASNVSNPSALAGHFLGLAGEAYVQDWGTPAAGTQLDVARLSVDLVSERIARNAMRAPGGTVPENPAVGIYTARAITGGLKVTYTKIAAGYLTDWEARTAKGGFFSWHMGRPGASTTKDIVALSFPRLVQNARPVEVDVEGLVGMEVSYTYEIDAALVSPYSLFALAFGSAA